MSDPIQERLDRIHTDIDRIQFALAQFRQSVHAEEQKTGGILRRYWDQGQQLSALKQTVPDYEVLQQRVAKLEGIYDEVRQHLHRILQHTKALTGEFLK